MKKSLSFALAALLLLALVSCKGSVAVTTSDLAGHWTSTSWTNSSDPPTQKGTMTMDVQANGDFSMVQSPVTGGTNSFSGTLAVANEAELLVTLAVINGSPAPAPPLNKQVIEFSLSGNSLTLNAAAAGSTVDTIVFSR